MPHLMTTLHLEDVMPAAKRHSALDAEKASLVLNGYIEKLFMGNKSNTNLL